MSEFKEIKKWIQDNNYRGLIQGLHIKVKLSRPTISKVLDPDKNIITKNTKRVLKAALNLIEENTDKQHDFKV